ncbi:hypothetical protein ACIBJC_07775 [Streptomyces sp. NPDC050509]|uniref:hypothetical protein n=1 Tax=Streptomyces sp. NPDC050509 TaxID=3365620 RepID=UPI0037A85FC9
MLRVAGGLAVAGAAGGVVASMTGDRADAAPTTFVHPGMLHAYGELNRAKVRVKAGSRPWTAGWERLVANPHSQSAWAPRPAASVIRGGAGQNYPQLYNDIHAAYQNALRWKIAGTTAHGDTARDILNAWSATLTSLAEPRLRCAVRAFGGRGPDRSETFAFRTGGRHGCHLPAP